MLQTKTSFFKLNIEQIYLLSILLLAAVLRFFHIDYFSFWFDEAASWHLAQLSVSKIVELAMIDNTPPVYHVFLHLWSKIGIDSDFAYRFPSIVFGLLAVFMTYKLGELLFNAKIGLFAAFFGAISFQGICYSQETRMYALQILLAGLSVYFFVKWLRQGGIGNIAIWIVLGILMFYNHLFAVFVFGAEWLFFLIGWRKYQPRMIQWAVWNLLLFLCCLPWIQVIINQMGAIQGDYWVHPADPTQIVSVFVKLTVGTFLREQYLFAGILSLPFAAISIYGLVKLIKDDIKEKWLLPVLIFAPMIIVYAYSLRGNSLFYYKYFVYLIPFIHILFAIGITKISEKRIRYAVLGILILINMFFLKNYYYDAAVSEPLRVPVKDIIAELNKHADPGETIIHQGVMTDGVGLYFVSLRYNHGRYNEYLWRDLELPFYCGMQLSESVSKIADLNSFANEQRIWVISTKFGDSLNEDGLFLKTLKRFDPRNKSSIDSGDLWIELKRLEFKLNSKYDLERISLFEFVKKEP